MYPLHLNHITTLPCKTNTVKITIFHGAFFRNTQILITNGQRTHRTLITMSGELCLNAARHFNLSQIPSTSWRMSCKQYVMICHRTSSLRESWGRTIWTRLDWNKLFLQGFELLASCDSLKSVKCQISIWFQYKHYYENCNFYSNCFTW